jgi:hypothetical protein
VSNLLIVAPFRRLFGVYFGLFLTHLRPMKHVTRLISDWNLLGAVAVFAVAVFLRPLPALAELGPDGRATFGSARTYPPAVTLAAQFSVRSQKYGSCHVFAAVAATQAACYRRTSAVLPISEGYLFALHLRAAAVNPTSEPFLAMRFASLFSENNAGAYVRTFERIQDGQVRLDREYAMSDLDRDLARAEATRAEFLKLKGEIQNEARDSFETRMRSEITADIDGTVAVRIGVRPVEPEVAKCQPQTLRIRNIQPTSERIVRLINSGFPVICQFHDSPPSSSSHVYVLAGYRHNNGFKDDLELFARNSLSAQVLEYGRPLNCYAASVIYAPEETASLDAALSI